MACWLKLVSLQGQVTAAKGALGSEIGSGGKFTGKEKGLLGS